MLASPLEFRSVRLAPMAVPLIALLATLGCAGGPGQAEPTAGPQAPAPIGTPFQFEVTHPDLALAPEGSAVFEQMLSLIPDTPQHRAALALDDLELVRRQLGVDRLPPEADQEAHVEYARQMQMIDRGIGGDPRFLTVRDNWVFGLHEYMLSRADPYEYLALHHGQADQSVVAGLQPQQIEVTRGEFDPQLTAAALDACAQCVPHETVEHGDAEFYAWGEDYRQDLRSRLEPPMFDHLGRGGRLWVTDEYAVRTLATDAMKDIIDASTGQAPSLADTPDFALAARALAGLGAHSAIVSDKSQTVDDVVESLSRAQDPNYPAPEEIRDAVLGQPLLLHFTVSAVGTGLGDGERFMALALVHDDEEAAEANVDRLLERISGGAIALPGWPPVSPSGTRLQREEVWADMVDRVEISTDGRVLLAKFSGRVSSVMPMPGFFSGPAGAPNSLLVYE